MSQLKLLIIYTAFLFICVRSASSYPATFKAEGNIRQAPSGTLINHLGWVHHLETYLPSFGIETLITKFSLHRREGSTEVISFDPSNICSHDVCEEYHYDLNKLAKINFKPEARTVIIISGFMSDDHVNWMARVRDLWLQLEDCNVIMVTWKDGNRYIYPRAVATTPIVARQISMFLYYLAEMNGHHIYDPEFKKRIHFIGHSLGAHIGGFLGQDLGGELGRIVALDPAGPSFDQFPREHRLDPSDALLVEVIHTNAGKMRYKNLIRDSVKMGLEMAMSTFTGKQSEMARSIAETFDGDEDKPWFGINYQVGHLDYYSNNGKVQPGCKSYMYTCDHGRSHHIYENILKHELQLKENSLEDDGWRKKNRLVAIRSVDYASFASGETLNLRCPAILSERDRLESKAKREIKHCTIPMDQLTPIDEYRAELVDEYGVNLSSTIISSERFYFKTLHESPLVGDHYLLRLKLERSSIWEQSCAFQAVAIYHDGLNTTMELNKEIRMFNNGEFLGITMPFINPFGSEARIALNQMLIEYTHKNRNKNLRQLNDQALKLVQKILPTSISLKIIAEDCQSTLEKVIDWFSRKKVCNCALSIISAQVHPLVGFKRSLYGLYELDHNQHQQNLSNTVIRMMSHMEHLAIKPGKEKIWPDNLSVENQNYARKLQAVVIG